MKTITLDAIIERYLEAAEPEVKEVIIDIAMTSPFARIKTNRFQVDVHNARIGSEVLEELVVEIKKL